MWSRLYRNHFIMAFPSFDTATNAWAPQADISWSGGPSRRSEFVRFSNRFMTEREAVRFALRRGAAWVNHHLRRSRGAIPPEQRRVIEMIGALKETFDPAQPPRREQRASARRIEKTLTFEQFKSAMAQSGLQISHERLQKSYAALVNWRKHNHLSWAEARRKVARSQQHLAQPPTRHPKAALPPLTERGWRRIG